MTQPKKFVFKRKSAEPAPPRKKFVFKRKEAESQKMKEFRTQAKFYKALNDIWIPKIENEYNSTPTHELKEQIHEALDEWWIKNHKGEEKNQHPTDRPREWRIVHAKFENCLNDVSYLPYGESIQRVKTFLLTMPIEALNRMAQAYLRGDKDFQKLYEEESVEDMIYGPEYTEKDILAFKRCFSLKMDFYDEKYAVPQDKEEDEEDEEDEYEEDEGPYHYILYGQFEE